MRERLLWLLVVAALLVGGWLVARGFAMHGEAAPVPAEGDFRDLFWSQRALDLAAQIGLILAGALGVAAILPDARADDEEDEWDQLG